MNANDDRDLVLRVLRGQTEFPRLVLEAGQAHNPFSIGRAGDWQIEAPGVADLHVWLAFNGKKLYARACSHETAVLGGVVLGLAWVEVPVPVELRIGGARVSIMRASAHDDETVVPRGDDSTFIDAETTKFDEERMRREIERAKNLVAMTEEPTCYEPVAQLMPEVRELAPMLEPDSVRALPELPRTTQRIILSEVRPPSSGMIPISVAPPVSLPPPPAYVAPYVAPPRANGVSAFVAVLAGVLVPAAALFVALRQHWL